MVDTVDAAQDYDEKNRQAAIAKAHNSKAYGKSHDNCIDCGDPISAGRKAALMGVKTCFECQLETEGA